ncbi:M13 family peptidase [Robertkochia marina]|uniref:M13 family peptidase n=1 Tax=Robertkochia marina TaxID=1227945 RepID=A0A4S3M3M5_9FLAO|nr:M13 family metallopeptidase [Robertkochia marina]THD69683.1 M13 family peptidase [Robertkochia marina]TRZ46971.1 M13 family peptidase [Robertkochia marina]
MKRNKLPLLSLLAAGAIVFSCKTEKNDELAMSSEEVVPGINLSYMDTTVAPQDDFFTYVNGTWLKETEIPADRTSWGAFNELGKKTDQDALDILLRASEAEGLDFSSDQGKAVAMFKTIVDTLSRNEAGTAPVESWLKDIESISDLQGVQEYLTANTTSMGNVFFSFGVSADLKNADKNVAYLGAASLGLPNRDYYMNDDERSVEIREKYKKHISRMLTMVGVEEAEAAKDAEVILALETELASNTLDKVDRRDPNKTYNPTATAALPDMLGAFGWNDYLNAIGAGAVDTLIVSQPDYIASLEKVMKADRLDEIKALLRWDVVNTAAGMLTTEMDKANWEFYSKELRGAEQQLPLDERALSTINFSLGEALGKLYVEEKFPAEAKKTAEEMIANVIRAYENRINALDWMDADTKEKAIGKLNKMTIKVGYPDKWKDYSGLEVKAPEQGGDYISNQMALRNWSFKEDIDKLDEPVDRAEWWLAPQVVNAYYSPTKNEIVFPAAILQPPFFNFNADAAVNYGGIGAVIGHEISHGFDDKGAQFDAEGNLKNWWTETDLKKFQELGGNLADQYSAIEVAPELFINGKYTLGENIGDLGGVNAAYDGLMLHLEETGNPGEIDGFTPQERFFMSWATVWRTKMRDQALRNRILTDTHSPGMIRAGQPLKNIDAFYEAFNVQEGDAMYLAPEERIKIW